MINDILDIVEKVFLAIMMLIGIVCLVAAIWNAPPMLKYMFQ